MSVASLVMVGVLVAVLLLHLDRVFANDVEHELVIRQDRLEPFDFLHEPVVFFGELVDFKSDEPLEPASQGWRRPGQRKASCSPLRFVSSSTRILGTTGNSLPST